MTLVSRSRRRPGHPAAKKPVSSVPGAGAPLALGRHPVARALLALCAALLCGGCFYTDPVNRAPHAEITNVAPEVRHVGEMARFSASSTIDPDGDPLQYRWVASECEDDTSVEPRCTAFFGETYDSSLRDRYFTFPIPSKKRLKVELHVHDRRGAGDATRVFLIPANRAPILSPPQIDGARTPTGSYTVGRELTFFARAEDADVGDVLTYTWELFPAAGSDPEVRKWAQVSETQVRLVPDVPGEWNVSVSVTDDDAREPLGDTQVVTFFVSTDGPPCLLVTDPPLDTPGRLVLSRAEAPRRFAVLQVSDELDPYPLPVDRADDDMGVTRFRWFVGGVPVEGRDLPDVTLDPATRLPGDVVPIRVEIADRRLRWPACADADATCSVSGDGCRQRATWEVEIR